MAGSITVKSEGDLLRDIYKNVKMAEESLIDLMPKVKDEKLKSNMTVQISVYEAFASRAVKQLGQIGEKPEEEGMLTKMTAKWGIMLNTAKDGTAEHMAQMLVEGTTMGVGDMLRRIRASEGTGISSDSVQLAKDVCKYQEEVIEQLKDFLREPIGEK